MQVAGSTLFDLINSQDQQTYLFREFQFQQTDFICKNREIPLVKISPNKVSIMNLTLWQHQTTLF